LFGVCRRGDPASGICDDRKVPGIVDLHRGVLHRRCR